MIKQAADAELASAQSNGTTTSPLGTSDNPSNQILTLANIITLTRLALTLIFLYLFVNHIHRGLAVTLYAIAAVTDFLDGQVARRTQTVSWFGKIMDPIMDRVLLFVGVLALLVTGEVPLWCALVVICRDLYLMCGALIVRHFHKRPIDVIYSGKVATALLMFGFCSLLVGWPLVNGLGLLSSAAFPLLNAQAAPAGMLFVYIGLVFSIITAIRYTKVGAHFVREGMRSNS